MAGLNGDPAAEKTFWNDVRKGLSAKGEGRPPEELAARAAKNPTPEARFLKGALVLTLGIDCQLDRCEWQVIGHGEHYRKFVIDVGTIGKTCREPDAQRNLDLLLNAAGPISVAASLKYRLRRSTRVLDR